MKPGVVSDLSQGELVIRFAEPHEIGTVCSENCELCGVGEPLTDQHANVVPHAPLLILREANEEDWANCIVRDGGERPAAERTKWYYYAVSTD